MKCLNLIACVLLTSSFNIACNNKPVVRERILEKAPAPLVDKKDDTGGKDDTGKKGDDGVKTPATDTNGVVPPASVTPDLPALPSDPAGNGDKPATPVASGDTNSAADTSGCELQTNICGTFSADLVEQCKKFGGGEPCVSNKWDRAFYNDLVASLAASKAQ